MSLLTSEYGRVNYCTFNFVLTSLGTRLTAVLSQKIFVCDFSDIWTLFTWNKYIQSSVIEFLVEA